MGKWHDNLHYVSGTLHRIWIQRYRYNCHSFIGWIWIHPNRRLISCTPSSRRFASVTTLYRCARSRTYEAWMRHQRCRTRVRCGRTRRRARDAAAHASGRDVPRGFHVFLADSRRCGSDSGRFTQNRVDSGLNRPNRTIQAEIQKRKSCKMHRLTYI